MKLRHLAVPVFVALAALFCGCGSATYEESPNPPNPSVDTIAPVVSSITPATDATSIAVNTTVTVTFSEAMDRTSVEGAFALSGSSAVSGTFSWTDDSTVAFTPSATLVYLTKYTVTLSTAAKDKAGNALAEQFNTSFTTIAEDLVLLVDGDGDEAKLDGVVFPIGPNASFTAEAWIYPTVNQDMIVVSDNAYDLGVTYTKYGPVVMFKLWTDTCGSSRIEITGTQVILNQWNHIAGVYNKDTDRVAVATNGTLFIPSSAFTDNFCSDLSYKFGIGNYNSAIGPVDQGFVGKINEVRISNVARYTDNFTPPETFTPDANTKGLWHFDDTIGSTSFADSSGNGYTLTAVGDAKTGR